MNSHWFKVLQRTLASASVMLRYARGVSRLLSYWLLLDEKREAERLRNEAARINNLSLYISVASKLIKTLKMHGASDEIVRGAMAKLLVPDVENQLTSAKVARRLADRAPTDGVRATAHAAPPSDPAAAIPARRAGDRAS